MPSFFKHARGVQKSTSTHSHKPIFHGLKKTQSYLSGFMPHSRFFAPAIVSAPEPVSTVFETNDCIWYHGTIYVKEAVAVARIQQMQQMEQMQQMQQMEPIQEPMQTTETNHYVDVVADDDDDTESISSGNGSIGAFKHPRSIGKQNQLKYLKDGMQLRHLILLNRASHEWNEWFATFDAETNRIIRTPDGVAFDTLRQFARLHCNEVLSTDSSSTNVWSDPQFRYHDEVDGQWHPLANLKKCN